MVLLLHVIHFIITDLSTLAWQKDVRQVVYEVVEAIKEAKKE